MLAFTRVSRRQEDYDCDERKCANYVQILTFHDLVAPKVIHNNIHAIVNYLCYVRELPIDIAIIPEMGMKMTVTHAPRRTRGRERRRRIKMLGWSYIPLSVVIEKSAGRPLRK